MMTQFGRIAHLTQSITEEPTPFQKELNKLSKVTAWVALLIGVVVAVVGYFSLGVPLKQVTLLALGIVVAVIPEDSLLRSPLLWQSRLSVSRKTVCWLRNYPLLRG
jgi:magnesium-transporting ATPase (P-type)